MQFIGEFTVDRNNAIRLQSIMPAGQGRRVGDFMFPNLETGFSSTSGFVCYNRFSQSSVIIVPDLNRQVISQVIEIFSLDAHRDKFLDHTDWEYTKHQ